MKIEKTVETVVNNVMKNLKSSFVKEQVIQKKRIDSTSLKEIFITTSNLDVEVKSHNNPYIDIILKTYENGPEMDVIYSEDKLEVSVVNSKQSSVQVAIIPFTKVVPFTKMEFYVPTAVAESWDVRSGSADINFTDVIMNKLAIHTGSGDISLSDIEAGEIKVRCASGDVKCKDIKSDSCMTKSASGDMVFRKLIVSNMTTESSSGDILLTDHQGANLEVKMGSGDVDLNDIDVVNGTIVLHSGDVDANRVQAEMLNIDNKSGDIGIDNFTGVVNGSNGSGDITLGVQNECTINLDANSGDIAVKLAKEIGMNATVDVTSQSEDITTNLPLQLKDDSSRLLGVTGEGENTIRITTKTGDVKVYMEGK
ncbi:DUF4097 family beta strand repeat-containing protein [Ornithinibacillus halotolerans]|uniref:DUF4097 domain-containing protein n=1 Tax=Ornithinibacillus halotolerans TaxID=1274357 RepID=A0A916SBY8_9BACI|nr:DUF4097 family beta strand repeat-containing protein [Ornithinibacillus halotolerans]GGA93057.1 hypothetical protein GCM10008025_39300 [Ornithinibacillus halotolerans]